MNRIVFLLLIVFLLVVGSYSQSADKDQVHMPIPGYNQHKWYSGYLHFDMGKFHYIFFESQRDPDNDPVVLWLNGGPGCSSLIGMVYQNGPFLFKAGTANIQINQYSWNKKANVIYLQTPGGVGFSQGLRDNVYSDGTMAQDNLNALVDFFISKFPNLKKNDFYISGQSYAGTYIPYLALEIIKYNKLPSRKLTFNFKGILIGNACTDPRQCYQPGSDDVLGVYQYEFLYEHGFYTLAQYNSMKAVCLMGYHGQACQAVKKILDKKFADTKVSLLNIYQKCFTQPKSQNKFKRMQNGKKINLQVFPDCDDSLGIKQFFNEPLISQYLHVDPIRFQMCSSDVGDKYQMFANASYWIYPLLMKQKLRVWVYSGDVDSSVPITGTIKWMIRMRQQYNIPIQQPWRQWWVPGLHKHQDQVGGMTWQLRGFTFASIKGAGHMAPKDNKKAAYILFDSYLNGVQLPFKSEQ